MINTELSEYERTSGHRRERHENCELASCMVCDLFICSRCGGLEGSLLPVCPGYELSMAEHDANYQHYCHGTGPFKGKG